MNPQPSLDRMAATANALYPDEHMNLVSQYVSVSGVPGFDVIGDEDWFKLCKHECENRLLKQASDKGLNVLARTTDSIMVESVETVEGADGSGTAQP